MCMVCTPRLRPVRTGADHDHDKLDVAIADMNAHQACVGVAKYQHMPSLTGQHAGASHMAQAATHDQGACLDD